MLAGTTNQPFERARGMTTKAVGYARSVRAWARYGAARALINSNCSPNEVRVARGVACVRTGSRRVGTCAWCCSHRGLSAAVSANAARRPHFSVESLPNRVIRGKLMVASRCWLCVLPVVLLAWCLPRAYGESAPPPVVDLHVDLPYQITAKGRPPNQGEGNYVARWLRPAGVTGVVLPLYVPRDVHPDGPQMADLLRVFDQTRKALAGVTPWTLGAPDAACAALGAGDSVAAFFSFEGATALGFELDSVERWVARGVRLFGLVHSYDTAVASSSGYTFRNPEYGLSRRGKALVRQIAALGGIIDVSHASDAATADILELAKARGSVVVATHSNARAVTNHPRNLTDSQIRAIGATGGVVGVAFHTPFLTTAPSSTVDDVVSHVLHVRKVGGIGAVALGSDFEGGIRPPKDMKDVRGFAVLARALRRAGLTDAEVRRVFGQNAERVLCPSALQR